MYVVGSSLASRMFEVVMRDRLTGTNCSEWIAALFWINLGRMQGVSRSDRGASKTNGITRWVCLLRLRILSIENERVHKFVPLALSPLLLQKQTKS